MASKVVRPRAVQRDFLKVENLGMRYPGQGGRPGVEALRDINIAAGRRDFICILGPSGCGKSTLLRLIAGFLQQTSGSISVAGEPVTGPSAQRGVIFQSPNLYPWLTVQGNVEFGLRMQGTPRSERQQIAEEHLRQVGLWEFRQARPYELSGGMQQRVAIAAALANDPDIILMDEPFAALDALTRDTMQEVVLELWRRTHKAILFVTHNAEEATYLGQRAIVLSKRPGTILGEVELPFSTQWADADQREIRSSPEFVRKREKILSYILGG